MTGDEPICLTCKHFHPDSALPYTCDAFPGKPDADNDERSEPDMDEDDNEGGIPSEIMAGIWDHTKPIKGDNGIQYEPKDEIKGELRKKGADILAKKLKGKK